MKLVGFKLSIFLTVLGMSLGMVSCANSKSSSGPPPQLGSMAGAWDFTVTGLGHPVIVEAILTQDGSGNISGSGTATANGPSGSVFQGDILGSALSSATDMAVDYLDDTCSGSDNGARDLTGTINSSNQVTITFNGGGGGGSITITGTLNSSATPPFSASGTVSNPACKSNGQNFTLTGVLAGSLAGNYSGTNAGDNTDTVTLDITDTSGSLSGNGTDSKAGNFTIAGTTVGNAFSATFTPVPSGGGSIFGYFDAQLGANGSILLISFQGGSAGSCPNGVPIDNGSCLLAILAKQQG